MRAAAILIGLSAVLVNCAFADEPALKSGPMVGAVGPDRAKIWVQAREPAKARVRYRPYRSRGPDQTTGEVRLTEASDLTGVVELTGLGAATRYTYQVLLDDGESGPKRSFRTAPRPDARTRVRIAVGGCALPSDPGPFVAWKAVGEMEPDLFFGNGDLPYADAYLGAEAQAWWKARKERYEHPSKETIGAFSKVGARFRRAAPPEMRRAWRELRETPGFEELSAGTPMLFGWDDHDTGLDNAGSDNPVLDLARALFQQQTANPAYGLPEGGGAFFRYRYGPVEIFALDDQSFRTPVVPKTEPAERTFLGAEQLAWLRRALQQSDAVFKLVSAGSPWHDKSGKWDAWSFAPDERRALCDWIFEHDVAGVVLLGGDVHRCEVHRHTGLHSPKVEGYPLYEVVSSALHRAAKPLIKVSPTRLYGVGSDTRETRSLLCLLDVDARKAKKETLTVRVLDAAAGNRELYKLTIRASELTTGR